MPYGESYGQPHNRILVKGNKKRSIVFLIVVFKIKFIICKK
jgi:hypothetical protein